MAPPKEETKTEIGTNNKPTGSLNLNNVAEFNFGHSNLSEEWKRWSKKFELFELASGSDSQEDKRRVALLLHSMGEAGIEIYNSFNLSQADEYKFEVVKNKFREHFDSKCPITLIRYNFFTCKQKDGQSILEFSTELQNLSLNCKFDNLRKELVRDIFIAGLQKQNLKLMLLKESNIDIDKAVSMCIAAETSFNHVTNQNNNSSSDNTVMKIHKSKSNFKKPQHNQFQPGHQGNKYQQGSKQCFKCGAQFTKNHLSNCPARSVTCFKCNQRGHYANRCRSKSGVVKSCEFQSDDGDEDESIFIGEVHESLQYEEKNDKDWKENLTVNNVSLECKLDTGSPVNLLPINKFNQIFPYRKPKINRQKFNLCNVSNQRIPVLGSVFLMCKLNKTNKYHRLEFIICDIECSPLLGLKTCTDLKLIERILKINDLSYNNILKDFSSLFSSGEVGTIGPEYHIKLRDGSIPRIDSQRKIPFGLRSLLKDELERMERYGIIERVIEPTEWVNSIVIVKKKNNTVRICLDPRHLNNYIITSNSCIPTFEQISSKLSNAKYFSLLDCTSSFWMVPLDDESSKLCTFNSPLGGRYCFKKLPYGLSCSSEAFQERMNFAFENVEGVEPYIDDILIFGSTREEHDSRLLKVLNIAKNKGLKFNKEKCKVGVTEIKFLGHILSGNGISMDPDKISAVLKMSNPTNKKELERLIGFFNYLSKFIPHFSNKTACLRELIKTSEFIWTDKHTECLNELKKIVTSSPVLKTFDPSQDVTLSVDSSIEGVGAVLLQNSSPVAFASKALSPTQKNAWAQIEREMFAIVFGCVKFHQYILGTKVFVETDHKALENLFKKPLNLVPARIQRLMLKVQAYNLIVKYKPGSLLYIADTLSRSPLPNYEIETLDRIEDDVICQVNNVIDNLPISKNKQDEILSETNKDPILCLLKKTILKGWPKNKAEVYNEIQHFWNFRDELNIINDLIFRQNALVIPKSMQKEMLSRAHEGHVGVNFSTNRVKDILFWPNMLSQIKDMCLSCYTCQSNQPNNCKENIIFHEIPNLPWSKLGCDLFQFNGHQYILLVDYYSKYFEISKLDNISAKTVILNMKSIFARHGIPKLVICDSGSQFTSKEFKDFSVQYEFDFICSSPYHHKSNGLAESHVKIVKNLLKKAQSNGSDPYLSLLNFRNTPKNNAPSPAQLLFSRALRTKIPVTHNYLKPKISSRSKFFDKERQNRIIKFHDKNSRNFKELNENNNILFKKDQNLPWVRGKILNKNSRYRSYTVQDENKNIYKRNRIHLKFFPSEKIETPNSSPISSPNSEFKTPDASPRQAATPYHTRGGRQVNPPRRFMFTD